MLVEQSESVGWYLLVWVLRTNYWCFKHAFCVLFLPVIFIKSSIPFSLIYLYHNILGGPTVFQALFLTDKDAYPRRPYVYTSGGP